jgi:hypothetical protein
MVRAASTPPDTMLAPLLLTLSLATSPAGPDLAEPATAPDEPTVAQPGPGAQQFPLYLAAGVGGGAVRGRARPGVPMSSLTGPQTDLSLEGSVRLAEPVCAGLYLDLGQGDAAGIAGDYTTERLALGVGGRFAFAPRARWNPWVGLGAGFERMSLTHPELKGALVSYTGYTLPRLSTGLDWRASRQAGIGVYATVAVVRYTRVNTPLGGGDLASRSAHAWVGVGVRFILFP